MTYDIFKRTAPAMPKPGKGTECIKLLLSQASKDMHEPLVPMLFPVLGAHVSASKFKYPDNTWKELCGMMANLVGDSGCNKGQFSNIVEAINRNFREHDKAEMNKLVEWMVYHDIWSKMQIFADMLGKNVDMISEAQRRGPKNMLDSLPDSFNEAQLEALRLELGKSKDGTKGQLRKWVFCKFITYSAQTGMYTKTDEYLTGVKS